MDNIPRVEAGKNTSTVFLVIRKRRRKGNPGVSDETIMYGYESSGLLPLTFCTTNYRPVLSSERVTPGRKAKQFFGKKKGKRKI
jgi:hypothetical protein